MIRPSPSFVSKLTATAFAAALSVHLSAQQFVNGSFENWGPSATCGVNEPPDDWVGSNGSGAPGVDEGNFVACPHTVPAGAQQGVTYVRSYATLGGGEGIEQTVSGFVPGTTYTVRYHYAGSNRWGGLADGFWRVSLDGTAIDDSPIYGSLVTTWTQRDVTFTATATSHTIRFRGYRDPNSPGSASLGLDDVSIFQAASAFAYGTPCSVGSALALTSDLPQLGATWTCSGSGIEPGGNVAVFWYGDTQFPTGADLSAFGAAGCFAYTNANLGAFVTSATTVASNPVVIPNVSALVGASFYVQMSAPSASTAIGFTTSNGIAATIGL